MNKFCKAFAVLLTCLTFCSFTTVSAAPHFNEHGPRLHSGHPGHGPGPGAHRPPYPGHGPSWHRPPPPSRPGWRPPPPPPHHHHWVPAPHWNCPPPHYKGPHRHWNCPPPPPPPRHHRGVGIGIYL